MNLLAFLLGWVIFAGGMVWGYHDAGPVCWVPIVVGCLLIGGWG